MKAILEKLSALKALETLELDNKKIILVILFSVLVLYLDINFVFKNQLGALKKIEPAIVGLKKNLENLKSDLVKMQELKKKQIGPPEKAVKAKKIIPSEQLASLLQNLSDIANKNNVKIEQIKPAKDTQISKQDKLPGMDKFQPVLITLDLESDYHNLGKFINDIENGKIFISVQSAKITTQQADFFKQKVNLVLSTYVKK